MVKRIRKVAEERLLVNQEAKDLKLKNLSGEIHICKMKSNKKLRSQTPL